MEERIDENTDGRIINEVAEQLLDEAAFTSSLITDKERESGSADEEHIYPTSKEETEKMEELLKQAAAAAEDPNEEVFREKYAHLSSVVEWSKKRHRTWLWQIILGALLSVAILYYFKGEQKKDVERAHKYAEQVATWTPCDTTITYEKCKKIGNKDWDLHYTSANRYKAYKLAELKNNVEDWEESAKKYQHNADTAKTQEAKDKYIKLKDKALADAETNRNKFDSIAAFNYEQVKEMAVNEVTRRETNEKSSENSLRNFMIFLAVLIPLYIWTGYPRGYELTTTRRRDKVLSWIRRVSFKIAAIFFGTGLLMNFLPDDIVEYIYANGRRETHREFNMGNIFVFVLKVGLMIVGAFIFCFISVLIMAIETLGGIRFRIGEFVRNRKKAKAAAAVAEAK